MNPKGWLVPQSNIQPEFNAQTVGSKGVQITSPQKNPIASRFFSRNASHCEALRETQVWGEQ